MLLADDLLDADPPVMKQMTDTYEYYRCSVLGVMDVARADTASYGIVRSSSVAERVERIEAIAWTALKTLDKTRASPASRSAYGKYLTESPPPPGVVTSSARFCAEMKYPTDCSTFG